MGRTCFISFKKENEAYKLEIQKMKEKGLIDYIDKSIDDEINSDDEDYIIKEIRKDIAKATVTIFLIGTKSNENLGWDEQKYIKRELRASLFDGEGNTRSGILGVVLPEMESTIYTGSGSCKKCHTNISYVKINDSTVIKEFSVNYYIENDKCHYSESDRYCVLVKWDDFVKDPEKYIEKAFEKREQEIVKKVTVRPE